MKNVLFFSILFCAITVSVLGDITQTDFDKIRLIVNDEIKKEISISETRMKEYISQEIKTVNVKISETDKRLEGFRLDNDVLAICPNAAATPLLSLDKYNRFTKNC